MNKKIYFSSLTASLVLMAASVLPASAVALNSTAKLSVTLDVAARTKADAQIDARIAALNNLETRIGQMTKVTAAEKASLDSTIQASVNDMTTLKAKIDADTDNATLKTDIQSITKGYRIYILVLPQGRITAGGDRIMTIVGLFNDLSVKLQTRITAAQAAGKDVTSLNASLSDMNAKTADANVQAQAAINEVVSLQPDNGDKTVLASNQAALKDARAKLKVAMSDLKIARQDAGSIIKALISMKLNAQGSATTTAQ